MEGAVMAGTTGRRTMLLVAGILPVGLLAGCGGSGRVRRVTTAVLEIEGVAGCEIESGTNGTFRRLLHGRIDLAAGERGDVFTIYDEAMRAVVTTLHEGEEAEGNISVGGIMGYVAGAEEFTVRDLDPDMHDEDYRLEQVAASTLYARYGLA